MKIVGTVNAVLHQKGSTIWSIAPEAMVFDALQLMAEKNVGALVVIDAAHGLVGIITERDYSRKVMLKGLTSRDTPVRQVMTVEPATVTLETSLSECMEIMTKLHVRHLPVLQDATLVGLISIGDLVKWTMAQQQMTIEHLENYIAGTYPA